MFGYWCTTMVGTSEVDGSTCSRTRSLAVWRSPDSGQVYCDHLTHPSALITDDYRPVAPDSFAMLGMSVTHRRDALRQSAPGQRVAWRSCERPWLEAPGTPTLPDPSGGDRVVRAGATGMSVTLARLGEVFVITWRLKRSIFRGGIPGSSGAQTRLFFRSVGYWFLRSRSGKTEDEALVNEIGQRSWLSSWEASRIFSGMPVPQRPRK